MIVHSTRAEAAGATVQPGIHSDALSGGKAGHVFAQRGDLTRKLMAKNEGITHHNVAALALEVVAQVRAADAAGSHAHQHLSRSGLWLVPLFQNNLFRFMQHSSDHWALFYLEFGHGGRYFR